MGQTIELETKQLLIELQKEVENIKNCKKSTNINQMYK